MKPVEYFSRDVHSFWATSFQLELKLFDQFLLRRLGDAPLNAVVLCDEDCLTETLGDLTDVDRFATASANRRYLLRGVKLEGGGRFHPKSYLFASRRRIVLLVGSGNLTRSGLDRGHETFVAYEASDENALPTIYAWTAWMRALVAEQDDAILTRRFEHLLASAPEITGPVDGGALMSNRSRALLDQLLEFSPSEVSELHVRAPYYDEQARAVQDLISRVSPTRAVHVHLGARTSVDGNALRAVLADCGREVHLHGYRPSQFAHAKLIGLVGMDGTGVLLCGSANLSNAALRLTHGPGAGNCELLVARAGTASDVVDAFCPPGSEPLEESLDDLVVLVVESDGDPAIRFPVRLRSAAFTQDERISVSASRPVIGLSVLWADATAALALSADAVTTVAVDGGDRPRVIWLVNETGDQCSNPVVVDEPGALERMLGSSERGRDGPSELRDEDAQSPLVSLLRWAHQRFIFDVDDTAALRRANNAQELQADPEDTSFWERYAREEILYDHRSQTYRTFQSSGAHTDADLLLLEIQAMLNAAPADRRLRLIGASPGADGEQQGETGHQWSFTARERVRTRNLLRRWARALPDPRHAWLSDDAPARNYEALLEVLALIWLGDSLPSADLVPLLGEMWSGFIGTDRKHGFLSRAEPELAHAAIETLTSDARELAAGLAYSALCVDGTWHGWIYEWKPFMKTALTAGVFRTGPLAVDMVEAYCDERPTEHELLTTIERRSEWIDDERWGEQTAADLGLAGVRIVPHAGYKNVTLAIRVDGIAAPAADTRVIVVARRAMALKKTNNVLIEANGERFLLRMGEVCRARVGGATRASVVPIDEARLAAVEQQQGTLEDLLGVQAAA